MYAALPDGYNGEGHSLSGSFVKGFSRKWHTYMDIRGDAMLTLEFREPFWSAEKTFQIIHLKRKGE